MFGVSNNKNISCLRSVSMIVTVAVRVSSDMIVLGSLEVIITENDSVDSNTASSRMGMMKESSVAPATNTTSILLTVT